jgi:hypothetical protein
LTMQGCVNGREWRAWPMKCAGIKDEQQDNGFTSIADPVRAQALMERLVVYPWAKGRNRWAQGVNRWLGPQPSRGGTVYYGRLRESVRHGGDGSQPRGVGGGLPGAVPVGGGAILCCGFLGRRTNAPGTLHAPGAAWKGSA